MTSFTQIDLDSPDPTEAINAFLWNMNKARSLGFTPPYKWVVAEHFFRDDVSLLYYSARGGALLFNAKDETFDSEESWDFLRTLMDRIVERRKVKEAAEVQPSKTDPKRHPKTPD